MTRDTFQRAGLSLFLLLVGSWYAYARLQKPPLASVNGIYVSSCCGEISLQDGVFIAGKVQVPFALENMKYGLTAFPRDRLEVHGSKVVVLFDENDSEFSLNPSGRTLTLCGDARCDREYVFKRR